jgi:spore germination cell wall hydrolase CwlJ-like protein
MIKLFLVIIVTLSITPSFNLSSGYPVAQAFPIEFSNIKPKSNYYYVSNTIKLSNHEYECLVRNIYFESGVESIEGKIAVAQVTFNRLNTGRWGNTVCKVVYAKSQFSWTKNQKKLTEKPSGKLWDQSIYAADKFLAGTRIVTLSNSTHYHADWIDVPRWAIVKDPVDRIGQHIFYTMR